MTATFRRILLLTTLPTAGAVVFAAACSSFSGSDTVGGANDGAAANDAPASDGNSSVADGGTGGKSDSGSVPCVAAVATDARNCGACGHDCGDASCSGGVCVAQTINGPSQGFGPNARIAIDGNLAAITDDQPQGAGGGTPGFVLSFDPKAAMPTFTSVATFQDHPSLITVSAQGNGVHWVHAISGVAPIGMDQQALMHGAILAVASNGPGTKVAVRVNGSVFLYDPPVVPVSGVPVTVPGANAALAFKSANTVIVATDMGISTFDIMDGGSTGSLTTLLSKPNVTHLAVSGSMFAFSTAPGEVATHDGLQAMSVAFSGLKNVSRVAIDGVDTYALDDDGLHTTRYGGAVLVPSATNPIRDFALSPPWVYFLDSGGLRRIRM